MEQGDITYALLEDANSIARDMDSVNVPVFGHGEYDWMGRCSVSIVDVCCHCVLAGCKMWWELSNAWHLERELCRCNKW